MENVRNPSKTRGESWKFQWMRQCLARKAQRNSPAFRKLKRRVVNPTRFPKTKHARLVEAHESTRQRLESSLPKDHEDHIAGKRCNSMTHYNLVHKFISIPHAMIIPDATAAVDKEWKKLETIPVWQLDKVKSKKEVILEAQGDRKESPLCYIN